MVRHICDCSMRVLFVISTASLFYFPSKLFLIAEMDACERVAFLDRLHLLERGKWVGNRSVKLLRLLKSTGAARGQNTRHVGVRIVLVVYHCIKVRSSRNGNAFIGIDQVMATAPIQKYPFVLAPTQIDVHVLDRYYSATVVLVPTDDVAPFEHFNDSFVGLWGFGSWSPRLAKNRLHRVFEELHSVFI